MRRSLEDISFMVRNIPYPGRIPTEISHLHCYITDSGHSILAVPKPLMDRAVADPMMYEVPMPVRFVLDRGWKFIPGTDSICVDAEYNDAFGLVVPDEYPEEF